jgi:N-carbamoylputrescine amidase
VKGSEDKDEVVIADLDLELIREVRGGWQFFRDLRPDMYTDLTRTFGK